MQPGDNYYEYKCYVHTQSIMLTIGSNKMNEWKGMKWEKWDASYITKVKHNFWTTVKRFP